ncbi:MAG: phage holin family protein [Abditibacteriaceae bacterium]
MIGFIIRLVVSVFALFLVAHFSNGAIMVQNMTSAVIAALVLGLANAFIKPILYFVAEKVTCVLSCITLGLWSLILSWLISALIFYYAGQWLSGFSVRTFHAALLGALVLAMFNSMASILTTRRGEE